MYVFKGILAKRLLTIIFCKASKIRKIKTTFSLERNQMVSCLNPSLNQQESIEIGNTTNHFELNQLN